MEDKILVRTEYPFGKCKTYRLPDGKLEYHLPFLVVDETSEDGLRIDFLVTTDWNEIKKKLREIWRPTSQEDLAWYFQNVV